MPVRRRFSREPTRYYGFVDQIIDADPENKRTRSFLLLDAIRADLFDKNGPAAFEEPDALALVRVMSTPKRWEKLYNLGQIAEGDWVTFEVGNGTNTPRAWELYANNDYASGRSRSIESIRKIADQQVLMNLEKAIFDQSLKCPRASADSAIQQLNAAGAIEIIILDVGQASAALIRRNGKPIGFFDIGAPLWFNNSSLPKTMYRPTIHSGFVILSHWDFDHFDLGRRHLPYRDLHWFAPEQPVGPNTAKFQATLGQQLTFISGSATAGGFTLTPGTSPLANDRNGSGYQLRYEENGYAVLLTGDATYDFIQPYMLQNVGGLTIPHHGGATAAPPPTPSPRSIAIASYGDPNSYRHPKDAVITAHKNLGWNISATAKNPPSPRGDRILFP